MPRAEWSFIGNVRILLPQTPDERKRIVDYIESEILSIDQLIRSINNEIKLILEYRACLISDAVTGQIDVRGWQPEPDDESDDEVVATLSETDENDESLDDEEIGDV